jgi:hypothetical protein
MAALLDEDRMTREIDEPVDDALAEFERRGELVYSHRELHRAVGAFMQAIFESALPCPRKVSLSQAHDEAVALLEEGYRAVDGSGFDGAVKDAADPSQQGILLVLARLAEWIKRRERRMYVKCVTARHIDPSDWHTKCAMAEILLGRCRKYLPPQMQSWPPEQLADSIYELLRIDLDTDAQMRRAPMLVLNSAL